MLFVCLLWCCFYCCADLVVTHALEWPSLTVQWLPVCQQGPRLNWDTALHSTAVDKQQHTTMKRPPATVHKHMRTNQPFKSHSSGQPVFGPVNHPMQQKAIAKFSTVTS